MIYATESVITGFNLSATLPLYYTTTDENVSLSGMGLKVHYDSSLISGIEATPLSTNLLASSDQEDSDDLDGDPSTDRFVNIAWAAFAGGWPGELDIELLSLDLTFIDQKPDLDAWDVPIRFQASLLRVMRSSAGSVYFAFGQLVDTDGDGLIDTCPEECLAEGYEEDLDDDNDGISDIEELAAGTSPIKTDTDDDGVDDPLDPYPLDSTLNSALVEDVLPNVVDPQLRSCIENPDLGSFVGRQVSEVTRNPPVATLEGLEQFSATALRIDYLVYGSRNRFGSTRLPEDFPLRNTVSDLSPISGLTSLNNLTLIGSLVDSLEAVSDFKNLELRIFRPTRTAGARFQI